MNEKNYRTTIWRRSIRAGAMMLLGLGFAQAGQAQAGQCLGSSCAFGGSQYPSGNFTTTSSSFAALASNIYAGEWQRYSVTSGQIYEWSLCAADGGNATYDSQLTLYTDLDAILCYSDDLCGDDAKIRWTATFTGFVKTRVMQYNCVTNSTNTTLVWRCESCGPPPAGSNCANPIAISSYPHASSNTTCGKGNTYGIQCGGNYGGGEDIVYQLNVTTTGNYNITVTATGGGSYIGWFLKSGANCAVPASCLANATSSSGTVATGSYNITSAGTYFLIIDTWPSPACSAFNLSIAAPAPPPPPGPCFTAPNGEYPSGAVTPICDGIANDVALGCGFNGEYTTLNLTAGTNYTFTSSVGTDWITISNNTGTIGYAFGLGPQSYTPTTSGTYRFYTHTSVACEALSSCRQRRVQCAPPPPVDPCTVITAAAACGNTQVTTLAGTPFWSMQTLCSFDRTGVERIYSYVAPETGTYSLSITANSLSDYQAWVWATSCGEFATWNCFSDVAPASTGTFSAGAPWTAGNTYYIMVRGEVPGITGNATWRVNCLPPANDACATPIVVSSYPYTSPVINNSAATDDFTTSTCSGPFKNVWWRVSGVCGTMTVSTCNTGTNFDTELTVFEGACGTLTQVACNDDATCVFSGLYSTVTWTATQGTDYYISVGSYSATSSTGDMVVSVTVTDGDGDGIGDSCDPCPVLANVNPGDACDDGNNQTVLDVVGAGPGCACAGVACTTDLDFVYQADGADDLDWQLFEQGTNSLVQTGGGSLIGNGSEATCLPDGCFYLVVTDGGGDGIVGGGYLLRVNSSARLIDNLRGTFGEGGFTSGATSAIDNNEGFCLPVGTDRLIFTSCDRRDWKASPCGGEFVVANANAAVSAEYGVNNANSGYQMWWYAPNGGYSFKRFQSHSTSNGLPASATRACHFQLNAWAGNQLVEGTFYNVKVRGRINGAYNNWGPACRLVLNSAEAQCPRTKLMDQPGNQFLSCGQSRAVATNVYVHAKPVRRMNANCNWVNANRYQFRFRIPAENVTIVKTSATGQYFVNTNGLTCGKTYEVDVRASFDNGATWCHAGDPYGDVCLLTTTCSFGMAQEGSTTTASEARVAMYPNPNRGDQLFVSLSSVEQGVESIQVDIYDSFGKRVAQRTIGVQDGYVNTAIALNGELANGMYLVSITAGGSTINERLVIQK